MVKDTEEFARDTYTQDVRVKCERLHDVCSAAK
jgi:hypothetical protein